MNKDLLAILFLVCLGRRLSCAAAVLSRCRCLLRILSDYFVVCVRFVPFGVDLVNVWLGNSRFDLSHLSDSKLFLTCPFLKSSALDMETIIALQSASADEVIQFATQRTFSSSGCSRFQLFVRSIERSLLIWLLCAFRRVKQPTERLFEIHRHVQMDSGASGAQQVLALDLSVASAALQRLQQM